MSRESIAETYARDGFVVVRRVFTPAEIAQLSVATDQLWSEGTRLGASWRHGNLFYNVAPGRDGTPKVRMAQWPSYHQPVMNAVRLDPRFAQLLGPLIGGDLKQIINQVHWKEPNGGGDFAWHQDSRFRKPDHAYRNLGTSYVQTGLAIDPHTPSSGCMRFVPGSHVLGDVDLDVDADVLGRAMDDSALAKIGYTTADVVDLVLEPGDVAFWNPYLVHASGRNSESHMRRLYINGYVRARDCDRGEWAFRDGRSVPLGPEPAIVHYENLPNDRDPHYV
ncbi:phytanoyl-CoA dioxygenase family protein [uncultured Sphingomonas sp.]|uniref:phytanoyl-CoA dioxygenase family protein n=1 Tax=uncultured Sphingomonas sp. TaxID=158754 RepID=UPI0025EAE5BB|nr:phytanoyl-CoA dioxygenase family protein [uncultured Sphingomonas sp.]